MAKTMQSQPFARPQARTVISIKGAREHNLKNVSLDIPRDQLVVITGLSGSGKSSLAFDTIYAEGQRRYMESLSSFAKRFIAQVAKPDVDFMFGLSPVISIEQKTIGRNPRSTVGTMTDISSYLTLLFATASQAHCPYCQAPVPARTKTQILDRILALPKGATVELRAPVFPVFGEDFNFLASDIRKRGYKKMLVAGKPVDISQDNDIDLSANPEMEVIVDKFVLTGSNEPGNEKQILTGITNALVLGDQYLKLHITGPDGKADKKTTDAFYADYGCPRHHLAVGDLTPDYFVFNNPLSACRTCLGLGTYMQVHPDLLVPDKTRSIKGGCFVSAAYNYQPDNWDGRIMYSLSQHYKFSLDTPFEKLPAKIIDILLNGNGSEKFELKLPPDAKNKDQKHIGKPWGFDGIARRIERTYKRYRQKQVAHGMMEAWLEKVMVEHRCPDCAGSRLRHTRLNFRIQNKNIHEFGEVNFAQLSAFVDQIKPSGQQKAAASQVLKEIRTRLDLLLGIGLDYLNFNRRSSTLSGGESQRIRLSTQIGSGLMGMLYVLDEPSIGLHPKDNVKMIATLRRLRDLGNTVIVVEHDEDTIKAADHVIEMGPGPGVHGGNVVAQGTLADIMAAKDSPTGAYFSGRKEIPTPNIRRPGDGKTLTIKGARENNLKNLTVDIPLRQLVCITGASGSGKSTLINDILYKRLYKDLFDTRVLPGDHDAVEGIQHVTNVIKIDQSPIGRTPHSNPATYIGFYDDIRNLFAKTPEAKKRGYNAGRFSFNVKTGRCAECSGDGVITTALYFMPDVEVRCESCKGARYNAQTLEVTYKGKTISDVLNMPVELGVDFFADVPSISKKIRVMDELGLGYLTLGQSATTLSGGEAQRIKLAQELSKLRRGEHVFYILDEPTTGLHLADVARLLECLKRLVEAGHSVLVIEHHLDVIKTADHVIDLGPEGGHSGGQIIATGTPEQVAKVKKSHTGQFLAARL